MKKQLLIVFLKNARLGHVKTRLASDIGNERALKVYKTLLDITASELSKVDFADIHLYFTDQIEKSPHWSGYTQFVQIEGDLGAKMKDAFGRGFELGYEKVVGIGSDLPELDSVLLQNAYISLDQADTVFGPTSDGGYYLLGMKQIIPSVFTNKKWSAESLLDTTKRELSELNVSIAELTMLNDIDTLEDLKNSSIASTYL